MPNGGSDCCATCWFNAKNKGEAGYAHSKDLEPSFCSIRNLPIEDPFYTYCGTHTAVPNGTVSQSDPFLGKTGPGRGSSGSPPRIQKRFANTCFPFWVLRSSSRHQSTRSGCTATR